MKFDEIIAKRENKVIYRVGDSAVKVFDHHYSKADILNEALNQARVEEIGLDIPKIRAVSKTEDGQWAITLDYIEGKTLAQLMEENPEKIDEYLEFFVDLQIKIHSTKAPNINSQKIKMQNKISQTDLDATTRYELHMRLDAMPKHNKVCHGDFNPTNIIVREDGTAAVIDWAHVTRGNASADVARTYLLFCLEDKKELAEKYLHIFCKKSDTAKQYVQKWMPIVAASQSVKGKKEERAFLLSWIDVVDYE